MAPAAPTTLPGSLLAAARSTPSRTFIEVWDESEGVVQSVTYADLAVAMLGVPWERDDTHAGASEHPSGHAQRRATLRSDRQADEPERVLRDWNWGYQ